LHPPLTVVPKTAVRVPLLVREGLQGGTRIGLLSIFLHKTQL